MPVSFAHADLVVSYASHIGRVRRDNEDAVTVVEPLGLAVVADGIGGQAGGRHASRQAVATIAQEVAAGASLVEAIVQADRRVAESGRHAGYHELGTTVAAVQMWGRDFRLAWVGDSRAYRFAEGGECLTRDHSVAGEMLSRGEVTAEQARVHPMRNTLTRAVGTGSLTPAEVDSTGGRLEPGASLLLCSDGLHGVLRGGEMHGIIAAARDVQSAVEALLDQALERGGPDNITLVLIGPS